MPDRPLPFLAAHVADRIAAAHVSHGQMEEDPFAMMSAETGLSRALRIMFHAASNRSPGEEIGRRCKRGVDPVDVGRRSSSV